MSAPGDAFSDVRGPPPPVRRVAPPPAPRSPAKKGDVAWHLHQALEAALTENEKLKAEIAQYKAAYGELPRDGRRTVRALGSHTRPLWAAAAANGGGFGGG